MKCNQNNNDYFKEIVNDIKPIPKIENLNNFYPSFHLVKNQVRWFKGSRDRGLKSDIAA